jgi:MFS family permease
MLPLIVRPALMELGGIHPGSPEFTFWFGLLFYIPAIAGGAFGLLGGYLTDRFGRQRILTASIMLYAVSSFLAGFAGRCALAVLAVWIVSRRRLLRCFLIPAAIVLPATFAWAGTTSLPAFERGLFLAVFFVIGQFSFWGNYLPRVFPLHLRGTGESFAANVGGRMLGSCFAALTQWLATFLPVVAAHPARVAYAAAGVAFLVTLANLFASRWLPEPSSQALPEDAQDI